MQLVDRLKFLITALTSGLWMATTPSPRETGIRLRSRKLPKPRHQSTRASGPTCLDWVSSALGCGRSPWNLAGEGQQGLRPGATHPTNNQREGSRERRFESSQDTARGLTLRC